MMCLRMRLHLFRWLRQKKEAGIVRVGPKRMIGLTRMVVPGGMMMITTIITGIDAGDVVLEVVTTVIRRMDIDGIAEVNEVGVMIVVGLDDIVGTNEAEVRRNDQGLDRR